MAGVGGYQAPANPAAASGPGELSQRTDSAQPVREWPDAKYGDNAAFVSQQQGAPLPQSPSLPPIVGLDAPSQRPGEPVTAGVDAGAGPGSEILTPAAPPSAGSVSSLIFSLAASDLTGALAQLGHEAMQRGL